jgi:hypothetical protein
MVAEKHALRIAVWTSSALDRERHEQSFLEEVRTFHVVPPFRAGDELQRQVDDRIRAMAAEDLARPGANREMCCSEAMQVEDRGEETRVTARVKDDGVTRY